MPKPKELFAKDIIKKALADVADGGLVVMLLRLNFFGGVTEKKAFFESVGLPSLVYVHRQRMSFTPDGKKDSIEYAQKCVSRSDSDTHFCA